MFKLHTLAGDYDRRWLRRGAAADVLTAGEFADAGESLTDDAVIKSIELGTTYEPQDEHAATFLLSIQRRA